MGYVIMRGQVHIVKEHEVWIWTCKSAVPKPRFRQLWRDLLQKCMPSSQTRQIDPQKQEGDYVTLIVPWGYQDQLIKMRRCPDNGFQEKADYVCNTLANGDLL